MIDARWSNTVRSYVNSISLMQELIVLAGVVLFFVGLALAALVPKVVALLSSVGALVYVYESIRRSNSMAGKPHRLDAEGVQDEHKRRSPDFERQESDEIQPSGEESREPEPDFSPFPQPDHDEKSTRPMITDYQFNIADFCDVDEEALGRESGAKSEFSLLVRKILTVVKEVNFAHTVAFWWINREKKQLVLENFVSDSAHFMSHRRKELGYDLISQVAHTGQPRIVQQLSASGQLEALGYYQNLESISSFVAVPIFFPRGSALEEKPVAVLSLDFLSDDVFGPESINILGQFAKTLSSLIKSYTGKYDLLIDSEVLRSIGRIREQMKIDFTLHSVVRSLSEETSRLVPWDYVTAVLFDERRKAWQIQLVMNRMNDGYVAVGQEIDHAESVVGAVIQSGVAKILDDTSFLTKPRYYHAERIDSNGSVLILPLNSQSRCYGALVVECKDPKSYSESDARVIGQLVESAAMALEIHSLNEVVNNYVLMDETTGVATRKYFMERLHQEVQRGTDYETEVTVVMFSVDSMQELLARLGKDGFDFVLQNVGRLVKSFIRSYDLIGRFDFNRFAVLLVNTSPNEAYVWAEKVRKNIASNVINIDQKSFSVTVSIGVCGTLSAMSDVELVEKAGHVLSKAIEAGGNVVRVY